ncbi:MAG: tetratricopeptide repeat protein [Bacteroidetes bacterium]|nr:tetratricopeptide repeat protein [Bacteroidota bacterium]MDA1118941.1 tetratricopeptide repeat protein [Bacteroidota bacterium]
MIKPSFLLSGIVFSVIGASIESCSPESTGLVSNTYHNTTAHYNAYFYASERMREIEESIYESADINYNNILDLYPQFDTTASKAVNTQIEDCIKKASIAIQRHPSSEWVEESYILVGKARYYNRDFVNAIETYKYVNKTSEDDDARHEALIQLIKTFVDAGESRNALAVSDFMKKEKLNHRNQKNLYLTRAYLFQKALDYNQMVQNLSASVPLLMNNEERAKIYFILGQVYQELGFNSEAYNSYKNCLKSNPNFDLSFYSKLNMAQVTELSSPSDVKQVRKYFKKLLRDKKNEEFRDKIYYEIANFEFKQDDIDAAIENYNKSIRISTTNRRQKGYSYLRLGEIYYSDLKNYELAKSYYDSVVSTLPKEEPGYQDIAERQKILADFVTQLNTISEQDSLLTLSNLDTAALSAFVDEYIVQKQLEQEEENKKKEKREVSSRRNTAFDNTITQINTSLEGSTWYFYNSSVASQGRSEFTRKWGNRPLEDNWRRSSKDQVITDQSVEQKSAGIEVEDSQIAETAGVSFNKAQLMASVPFSQEDKNIALTKIEDAYFKLGNIYAFQLEEEDNAIITFETMLARFPDSEFKPEVMYQLYLLYRGQENIEKQDYYKNALIEQFPKSIFARIIINPNYRADSQAATARLEKIYKEAYELQEIGVYDQARSLIRNALIDEPENNFSDNLKLLEIIIMGHTEDIYKYQYELNNFITTYAESDLLPYAKTLVKTSEDYQINLFNSSKAKFSKDFNQVHYFVLAYEANPVMAEELPAKVQHFYKTTFPDERLNPANLILDASNSLVMVNEFKTKDAALKFYKAFMESDVLSSYITMKFFTFVITKDNFKIFYETKELESYKEFFASNYL